MKENSKDEAFWWLVNEILLPPLGCMFTDSLHPSLNCLCMSLASAEAPISRQTIDGNGMSLMQSNAEIVFPNVI